MSASEEQVEYMKKHPEIELEVLECYPLSVLRVEDYVDKLLKA